MRKRYSGMPGDVGKDLAFLDCHGDLRKGWARQATALCPAAVNQGRHLSDRTSGPSTVIAPFAWLTQLTGRVPARYSHYTYCGLPFLSVRHLSRIRGGNGTGSGPLLARMDYAVTSRRH